MRTGAARPHASEQTSQYRSGGKTRTRMTEASESPNELDQGLAALVMLLRFHGVGADPGQIRHRFAAKAIGTAEMRRYNEAEATDAALKESRAQPAAAQHRTIFDELG